MSCEVFSLAFGELVQQVRGTSVTRVDGIFGHTRDSSLDTPARPPREAFRLIELAGALSEPREQARWERLVRRLAESPGRTPPEPRDRQLPRRPGWVWPAIRRVLAAGDAPMRPIEIYEAVVDDLDTPVSRSRPTRTNCGDVWRLSPWSFGGTRPAPTRSAPEPHGRAQRDSEGPCPQAAHPATYAIGATRGADQTPM
jgi:hypothetical protein